MRAVLLCGQVNGFFLDMVVLAYNLNTQENVASLRPLKAIWHTQGNNIIPKVPKFLVLGVVVN